jgi:exodeoxyribonuclease VII small subunit
LPKFEECLQRLEKIVQELEKGEVPLEKSLTLFEEGMQLSSACRMELEQAEGKVEILLKKNGKLQAEPFEALMEKSRFEILRCLWSSGFPSHPAALVQR